MKLANFLVICVTGAFSHSAFGQVMYEDWRLYKDGEKATLYSSVDYEAPVGINYSLTCTKKNMRLEFRDYAFSMDGFNEERIFEDGRLIGTCDALCRKISDSAYRDYENPQIKELRPKKAYVSSVDWTAARQKILELLQDDVQFGDQDDAMKARNKSRNMQIFDSFASHCGLPSERMEKNAPRPGLGYYGFDWLRGSKAVCAQADKEIQRGINACITDSQGGFSQGVQTLVCDAGSDHQKQYMFYVDKDVCQEELAVMKANED